MNPEKTLSGMKWQLKTPASSLPLFERLQQTRNIDLEADSAELPSPSLLKDSEKAAARLEKAIETGERIMIFGDFDADGVCGASTLYLGLKQLTNNISVRLPHRERDGHGLNTEFIEECKQLDVHIIITVDCGISNVTEIEQANQEGIDVIITDHHDIPAQLPPAFAILNPKQEDCAYPEPKICGTVVGFNLLQLLYERLGLPSEKLTQLLDLCAIATVADCMPLNRATNRIIVNRGLDQLKNSQHPGLKHLVNMVTNDQKYPISSETIGFYIAPRINAAGRLGDPNDALKMIIGDHDTGRIAAEKINFMNQERRSMVSGDLESVLETIDDEQLKDPVLILWNDQWSTGIVGLLAGRLSRKYYRPTICLTRVGDKYAASCRSIPEINIVSHLEHHSDLFLKFGGHEQAAGFTIAPEKLEEMKQRLIESINKETNGKLIEPVEVIDTELTPEELTLDNHRVIRKLEPFGMNNPKPQFLLRGVKILDLKTMGDGTHLSLLIQHSGMNIRTVGFGKAEHLRTLLRWQMVDIVCTTDENHFNGQTTLQLMLVDARPTSPTS